MNDKQNAAVFFKHPVHIIQGVIGSYSRFLNHFRHLRRHLGGLICQKGQSHYLPRIRRYKLFS